MTVRYFAAPAAGDVVLLRVTLLDPNKRRRRFTSSIHPAVVLKVVEPRDPNMGVSVTVAWGSSNRDRLYPEDVEICRHTMPVEFARSGLSRDTCFHLMDQVTLPYTTEWFAVPSYPEFGHCPKIGLLHPDTIKRVQKALRAWNASKLNPKNEGKVKGQSFDPRSV